MTSDHRVGVQSVVFQSRPLADVLDGLDAVGIDNLELWDHHLAFDDGEERIEEAEASIDAAGVNVCGHGVIDLDDTGQARDPFAFADRLGAGYVTVNYSSVHHDDLSSVFSTIGDVRDVLDRCDDPRLGLCVDTGHFLVEDVTPEAVISEFGDRINSVHLKDTSRAHPEDVPGSGRLDLAAILALLADHASLEAPLVIEYELPADRVTETLREAVANVEAAIGR